MRARRLSLVLIVAALGLARPLPAAERPGAEVQRLIEQLGSQEYIVRRRAERELLRLGAEAFDALTAAENHPDLEIAARARYLARRITIQWARPDDPAEVKRIMSGYDEASNEERLERARQLLALPDGAGIAALTRIVRFEKSQLLSKQAAVAWLESSLAEPPYWREHRERIQKSLGATTRPAGKWLRARLLAVDDPQAALAAWRKAIADERQLLAALSGASDKQIVLALMRREVELLKGLGRNDEAVAAMIAMIDLEDGGTEELTELVDWLVEQKAWSVIDRVAKRFDAQFRGDWSLLYLLAEARQAQGKTDEARELAERAFQLGGEEPTRHWRAAAYLQQRGQDEWAEREYRKVIEIGPRGSRPALYAARWLAEMLHDQGKDKEAGDALKKIADLMERDPAVVQAVQRINLAPAELRARMEYFFAEAAAGQKEFAKQKEHLDRAIAQSPTDADVLIAMYHLPGASDDYRAKTKKLIAAAAEAFEQRIENSPDDASGYNQYAWLIGNTEGDLDKAIRYSHRSLELMPNTAGYLDTLGHAYFTKGDYKNAVRYQQLAADLDPHAGLITRPLAKFKAALEKQRAESGSRKAKSGADAEK